MLSYNNVLFSTYFMLSDMIVNMSSYFGAKVEDSSDVNIQRNGAFWIVLLYVLLGVATVVALMWACNKWGNGAEFLGEFKVIGLKIHIKCG